MRIFVTGGAGFIGSCYLRQALTAGNEVTNFDALTYAGNLSTIQDITRNSAYSFVHGDIRDANAVDAAMRNHDAVVHFAAESHVDRSIAGPQDFMTTNCVGTSVVMETARRLEVQRVIHISTDEAYGSIENGSFTEVDRLTPRSPYSASKAGSDLIALSYFTTYGLPVIVTRSSNNFGQYQHPEKLIPLFVTNLLDDKKVPLMGDGGNVRDWMFVEDHCSAVNIALQNGTPGEIYNIGASNEVTNRDLTDRLLDLLNKDESYITPIPDRLGHDRRYSMDTSKISALGWKPKHDLNQALEATVAWYANNRQWWEPLKTA